MSTGKQSQLFEIVGRYLLLIGCFVLFSSPRLWGTNYYVDAQNGNDSNNGVSAIYLGGNDGPWKTISKVNNTTFIPGDQIFFKRGGTWTDAPLDPKNGGAPGGTITIFETILGQPIQFQVVDPNNHQSIYFGAYGSGEKPKIDCQGGDGLVIRHNYIIVENLHLDSGGNNMLSFSNPQGNYWNVVKNVDVTHCDGNVVRFEEGGGNCWLDGLYVYDYTSNGIYLAGSEFNPLKQVLVENCRVDNPSNSEKRDAISCHRDGSDFNISGDIIIRNNTITRSGEDAIDITSGTNILLSGNVCEYSRSAGIFVGKDRVNTVEIRGNFLNSNTNGSGVGDLTIGATKVWAVNNIIIGTGHHSILIKNASDIQIWHNVVAPSTRTGHFIWFSDENAQAVFKNNIFDFSATTQDISGPLANHTFDYNCYYGRSSSQEIYSSATLSDLQSGNPFFEPNGFWADPGFADAQKSAPEHFKLTENSPCLDQGIDLPLNQDFAGHDRPQGNGPDMGVFEKAGVNKNCFPTGTPCDDNDPTTHSDEEDGDCNCIGTPCPSAGTLCDDGNPDTGYDKEDGSCNCAGIPCPITGTTCDDGDPATYDDLEDGSCNCVGTPCPESGTACDDGNPDTENDVEDGQCNCAGSTDTPTTMTMIMVQVNDKEDDVEERTIGGRMNLHSSDLELVYDDDRHQTVGIRFNELNIPIGSTITRAYIQFTAEDIEDGNAYLTITGQAIDDAPAFTYDNYNASSRSRTTILEEWIVPDWKNKHEAGPNQQTPDLSGIVQEIINRKGWLPGNSMVFLFEGSGSNSAESYNGSKEEAPKLIIEYATDCPIAGTPCDDGNSNTTNDMQDGACHCNGTSMGTPQDEIMIMAQVNDKDDDVEERTIGGSMSLHSSDLELVYDGSRQQTVGIRFNELDIPKGATITQAYLQFTVEDVKADDTNLTITGQNVGNAPPFSEAGYDASSRSRTSASIFWDVPDWPDEGESGADQQTTNLSEVVQEIVNHSDWQPGNSMVFLVEGNGVKSAESYEGSKEDAPKLIVKYVPSVTPKIIYGSEYHNSFLSTDKDQKANTLSNELPQMEVFPNPVNDQLIIRTLLLVPTQEDGVSMTIHHLDGKVIRKNSVLSPIGEWTDHQLDVSQLSSGFYFVSINTGTEVLTSRFIKIDD